MPVEDVGSLELAEACDAACDAAWVMLQTDDITNWSKIGSVANSPKSTIVDNVIGPDVVWITESSMSTESPILGCSPSISTAGD